MFWNGDHWKKESSVAAKMTLPDRAILGGLQVIRQSVYFCCVIGTYMMLKSKSELKDMTFIYKRNYTFHFNWNPGEIGLYYYVIMEYKIIQISASSTFGYICFQIRPQKISHWGQYL